MIAKLEWTQSNTQQNIEQLRLILHYDPWSEGNSLIWVHIVFQLRPIRPP